MQLSAYAYTNRGGRDHNEDSLRASAEQGIFVLADGLGGHRCGEVASQAAVDAIFTGMAQAEALEEASLLDLFRSANEELLRRQAQPGQEEMRTTAVALKLRLPRRRPQPPAAGAGQGALPPGGRSGGCVSRGCLSPLFRRILGIRLQ